MRHQIADVGGKGRRKLKLSFVAIVVVVTCVILIPISRSTSSELLMHEILDDGHLSLPNPTTPALTGGSSKTRRWPDWPAIAYEEVGKPLVMKGESFFHEARSLYFKKNRLSGKTLVDEFIEVYKKRPDPVNLCGIRINHAMALFLAVKQIQPTLVVESGVNAGVSTYFIRAASPTTKIFAFDPRDEPWCEDGPRWIDTSSKTTYYTGKNFVDLLEMDWKGMIDKKQVDPETTLIFIDDHLHAFNRIVGTWKFGFRHFVVEDNYKMNEGKSRTV